METSAHRRVKDGRAQCVMNHRYKVSAVRIPAVICLRAHPYHNCRGHVSQEIWTDSQLFETPKFEDFNSLT